MFGSVTSEFAVSVENLSHKNGGSDSLIHLLAGQEEPGMNTKYKIFSPILSCIAGIVLLTTTSSSVYAQVESLSLEEIIVTARKREESLLDTPVVISALSAKTINSFAIETMEGIADFTPGLLNVQTENQQGGILRLRGVGSGANSPVFDQAVSMVIDDMQVGTLLMQRSAILDMEAVQVYKGPQALFFGKNSPGGVVSIRSADPGDEFEAQVKTGYEVEAKEWYVQGVISGPFSDTVAGRLVARYTESDGYFDINDNAFATSFGDQGPASESVFLRGTLIFEPNDDLSIRSKLTYADHDAEAGATIQRFLCPFGAPQNSLPFECEANNTIQVGDIPQGAIDAFADIGVGADPTGNSDSEQVLLTVGVDYALNDELTLSSVTGYYETQFTSSYSTVFGLSPEFLIPALDMDYEQVTQELRLASDYDSAFNFVTGVHYESKTQDSNNPVAADLQVLAGFPVSFWAVVANTQFEQESEAYSVFLDMNWDISDTLELSVGARYSYEEKEFVGTEGIVGSDKKDWNDVSPQATLSWRPNDEWMFYASYREGFKSGGFDGSFQFVPITTITSYDQEEVDGFEFGAKGTLLDNTLQVSAALYAYEYSGLQLSLFDANTASSRIFNAGSSDVSGLEFDFVWLTPVDGLQARGALAYNDTEINDVLSGCYAGQSITQGCNQNPVGGVFQSQDIAGNELTLAPEVVGNLGLSFERDLNAVVLGLSLDVLYTGEYEPSNFYIPGTKQNGYAKLNAAVRLSGLEDTWSVALIGRNLSDEYPVYSGSSPPFQGSGTGTATSVSADFIGTVGIGRTFAVELEYNF